MKISFFFAAFLAPLCVLGHGELDARIRSITTEIARSSNTASLYVQRGELHREHRDWTAALADFQHAAALDGSLVRIDFFRARVLNESGDTSNSRALLNAYLSVNTNDCDAFVLSAKMFALSNLTMSAVDHYSRAIAASREPDPELFLERASLLASQDKMNAALQGLDEGVEKTGGALTLHLRALELELALTNHVRALSRLEKIIAASPRKESWLVRRGDVFLQTGQNSEAREAFDAAAKAIAALPLRLQTSDPMKTLSEDIRRKLAELQASTPVKPAPAR